MMTVSGQRRRKPGSRYTAEQSQNYPGGNRLKKKENAFDPYRVDSVGSVPEKSVRPDCTWLLNLFGGLRFEMTSWYVFSINFK